MEMKIGAPAPSEEGRQFPLGRGCQPLQLPPGSAPGSSAHRLRKFRDRVCGRGNSQPKISISEPELLSQVSVGQMREYPSAHPSPSLAEVLLSPEPSKTSCTTGPDIPFSARPAAHMNGLELTVSDYAMQSRGCAGLTELPGPSLAPAPASVVRAGSCHRAARPICQDDLIVAQAVRPRRLAEGPISGGRGADVLRLKDTRVGFVCPTLRGGSTRLCCQSSAFRAVQSYDRVSFHFKVGEMSRPWKYATNEEFFKH